MSHSFRTVVLLGLLTGLLPAIGQAFGGSQGLMIAFVFAAVMTFGAYWFSDKVVLAMYRAREVGLSEAEERVRRLHAMALR